MGKTQHSTSSIQRPPAEPASELPKPFDVGCSKLHVECSHWLLLNSGLGPASFNMALDEALLEAASRLGKPVLRFYGWTEPAATFGYFQKYDEVAQATMLRPLIRRPTGGGLVLHDADWTYSLAFPAGHGWHGLRAEASYRRMHEWLQAAFATLNVETELAPCARKSVPGQCFIGHEKSDLLWRGRKIAGAAQRRNKLGLLIQGSVQPPPLSLIREEWQKHVCETGHSLFGLQWQDFELEVQLRKRAEELVRGKYSLTAYNAKRFLKPQVSPRQEPDASAFP